MTEEIEEMPAELIPAPVTRVISLADDPEDTAACLDLARQLEETDLGCILAPYNAATTASMMRELHRGMLQSWLQFGAYAWRAKLIQGTRPFWSWFDAQGFPFSRTWARESIAAVRQIVLVPEIGKLVRRMHNIRHFKLVAKRLCDPAAQAELVTHGTIDGLTPEELDETPLSRLTASQGTGAASDQQLNLLPLQEVTEQRNRIAEELEAVKKKAVEVESALVDRTDELARTQRQLLAYQNPQLNQTDLEKEFLATLEKFKAEMSLTITQLRPLGRRDIEGLSDRGILAFYGVGLLLEKQVHLLMREIELCYGKRLPELLLDESGRPRAAIARQQLRMLDDQVKEAWRGANAAMDGKPVVVVTPDGEVLHDGSAIQ